MCRAMSLTLQCLFAFEHRGGRGPESCQAPFMTETAARSVGRVFISYRRQETAYAAGWLFDRLVDRYGRGQIFKDVDSIELGDDFVEVISTAVGSCDVLLALIGDQWLTITDEQAGPASTTPMTSCAWRSRPP